MNIIVRDANVDDLSTLRNFEQGIISIERTYDKFLKEQSISYYDLQFMIDAENAVIAVVEIDGEVVASGFVEIKESLEYKTHDRYGSLRFMYVDPSYRGKGLNRLVIDYLTDWCKSRGLDHVILHVYTENESAIKAYEKLGLKKSMIEMTMSI